MYMVKNYSFINNQRKSEVNIKLKFEGVSKDSTQRHINRAGSGPVDMKQMYVSRVYANACSDACL